LSVAATIPPLVIQVTGLTTRFGESVIHKDLNLSVYRGEILCIVGGSGSGKTTLLRELLGLDVPTEGRIEVLGIALAELGVEHLRELRRRSGVLYQSGALFSALTVLENVALPLHELHAFDEELIREVALMRLERVGLKRSDAVKLPAELSGGMIKRVALARALVLDPGIVFLDEPTAGLDPESSETFVALIKELHRELRLSVVMVTHDLDTLVALADRVAVLADQRVIVEAPLSQIIHFKHPFIESYFLEGRGRRALAGCGVCFPPGIEH
jgi:phospholipid/cholesterol/gamma-HCH transport system ATP-binding protein